jgi:hypothetical protein
MLATLATAIRRFDHVRTAFPPVGGVAEPWTNLIINILVRLSLQLAKPVSRSA